MNKQRGMASAITILLLLVAVVVCGYFWWSEYEQRLALATEVDKLEASVRSHRGDAQEKTTALNEEKSANFRLNQQLRKLTGEVDTYQQQLDQSQLALQKVEARLQELATSQQNLEADKETLVADKETLAADKESLEAEQNRLLAEKDSLEVANGELQQKLASLDEEIESLNSSSTQLAQQYQAARSQLDSERNRVQSINQKVETLEERLNREQGALEKLQSQLGSLNDTNASLNEANSSLSAENERLSIEKEQLVKQFRDGTTIIRLPNRVLFPSGSATLNDRGEATLKLVAKTLQEFSSHMISVEGHSDNRKIGPELMEKYPSNWELSAARSASAIRLLIDEGLPAEQFQAVGYAHTRPLTLEEEPEKLRQNRRIEILLLPPLERPQKILTSEVVPKQG